MTITNSQEIQDALNFVRTRTRGVCGDRFTFQTVWNFSADGINEEVYLVSAVIDIDTERVCETYIFPCFDDDGTHFSGFEVYSSPDFKGTQHDHKLMLGEYLHACGDEHRNKQREIGRNFENLIQSS